VNFGSNQNDLYTIAKGKAYALAELVSGASNEDARRGGYRDVFDFIMSDSEHSRYTAFVKSIGDVLPEGNRKILLDGLAREYAGVDGWGAFVERRTT
jgi:hypothetical protein